jgi:hypothetical protein
MAAIFNHRKFPWRQRGGFHCVELAAALVVALLVILLIMPTTNAADSPGSRNLAPPGSPQQTPNDSPPTERDCQFALFARDSLLQDQTLAPFNVGVTVRSGVATLWGTVPSPAIARRAEERIRLVPGLAQVRNDLRISALDDEMAEFLKGPTPQTNLPIQESKRWEHSAPLVSRGEDSRLSQTQHVPPMLMPTIEVPPRPTKIASSIESVQTLKAVAPTSLVDVLEHLRRKNERFQTVGFEVQGGVVHLWGNALTGGDIFTLAQQVAHIPGVQRVVVERSR